MKTTPRGFSGLLAVALAFAGLSAVALSEEAGAWPMLKTYDMAHQRRIRLPIGGIGTGTISLSGVGGLVDWELFSRPNKGWTPQRDAVHPAFLVRTESPKGEVKARLLEGPLDTTLFEGVRGTGCVAPNHGYPRFRDCTFRAAYPLAEVVLSDEAMPVSAKLEAMNPLVPGDAAASGLPVALLRWNVTNVSSGPLKVSVLAAMPNPSGGKLSQARVEAGDYVGVGFSGAGDARADCDVERGEFAVLAAKDAGALTTASSVRHAGWNDGLDQLWWNFVRRGELVEAATNAPGCVGTHGAVCVAFELKPGETRRVPFVLAWRYPHRHAWNQEDDPKTFPAAQDVGNWYATQHESAVAVAAAFVRRADELEARTVAFVKGVLGAKAPDVVKEAALFNLSTFRSQTCFRTADGNFFGWEGCYDQQGSCFGSCTHVWGYEHALVDLWPDLAKTMSELQFGDSMATNGLINFRIVQPSATRGRDHKLTAADGQMQCVIKAYEVWKKTGDAAWLQRLWPNIRTAMEFCWLKGGWDADRDGVMEGCQHNTMDVEYYGPNPQMEFLYLAALKASAAMADAVLEQGFAADCRALAAKGSAWTEKNLFNGEYYEHQVRSARGDWLTGTRAGWCSLGDPDEPNFQLGSGCLIDQLVGDYAARTVGLGPVADYAHARKATETILKRNRREPDAPIFNHMRDYVLAGERSLTMAWYPPARKPKTPFPYYSETMTGFEYVVAAWLAETGDFANAEEVVRDIRARYDGAKRSPFDEAECGHHYARALVSWTVFKAWEGKGACGYHCTTIQPTTR